MVRYGMPRPGPQRVESTRPTTSTNRLSVGTGTSSSAGAKRRPGRSRAARRGVNRQAPAVLARSSMRPWIGYRGTTRCTIIAAIQAETIPSFLSARAWSRETREIHVWKNNIWIGIRRDSGWIVTSYRLVNVIGGIETGTLLSKNRCKSGLESKPPRCVFIVS